MTARPSKVERRARLDRAIGLALDLAYGRALVADARKAWLSCEIADARACSPLAVLIWMAVLEWHHAATDWHLPKTERPARLADLAAMIKALHCLLNNPLTGNELQPVSGARSAPPSHFDHQSRAAGEHLQGD